MRSWWRWWFGGHYGRGGLSYERLFEIVVATAPVSYWLNNPDPENIRRNISR